VVCIPHVERMLILAECHHACWWTSWALRGVRNLLSSGCRILLYRVVACGPARIELCKLLRREILPSFISREAYGIHKHRCKDVVHFSQPTHAMLISGQCCALLCAPASAALEISTYPCLLDILSNPEPPVGRKVCQLCMPTDHICTFRSRCESQPGSCGRWPTTYGSAMDCLRKILAGEFPAPHPRV
jgi:hypothetical protein